MMKIHFQIGLTFVICLCSAGCPEDTPKNNKTANEDFAQIRIHPDNKKLLFTYLQADGSFQTVDGIDQVPEKAREQVIVVDTQLSPEQRRSAQVLYVADLSQTKPDGSHPYSLVSRFKFERDLMRDPAGASGVLPKECEALPDSPKDKVLLYETSWCGVCKAAKRFMREQGIPFLSKDLEKDPGAQKELSCKALKAKKRLNGVPVLDVGGQLMLGFDGNRLLALTRQHLKVESTPSPDSDPKPATPQSP
ncbi:MAG: glutaredoxin family protein [Deltaproteobacteria bacterium]|nr:glutaredoxin family protein [Deltaproteobacteria bacterium]